mmetsp:Transcript_20338/g.51197  ORF Transcript_20338/g.51197 Transcript_20338/m.51197 type:complete len:404 (+) Transcript_20338:561-1772(+)
MAAARRELPGLRGRQQRHQGAALPARRREPRELLLGPGEPHARAAVAGAAGVRGAAGAPRRRAPHGALGRPPPGAGQGGDRLPLGRRARDGCPLHPRHPRRRLHHVAQAATICGAGRADPRQRVAGVVAAARAARHAHPELRVRGAHHQLRGGDDPAGGPGGVNHRQVAGRGPGAPPAGGVLPQPGGPAAEGGAAALQRARRLAQGAAAGRVGEGGGVLRDAPLRVVPGGHRLGAAPRGGQAAPRDPAPQARPAPRGAQHGAEEAVRSGAAAGAELWRVDAHAAHQHRSPAEPGRGHQDGGGAHGVRLPGRRRFLAAAGQGPHQHMQARGQHGADVPPDARLPAGAPQGSARLRSGGVAHVVCKVGCRGLRSGLLAGTHAGDWRVGSACRLSTAMDRIFYRGW